MAAFDNSLIFVRAHEGGFVDHESDPGGATNFGITQATYDVHRQAKGFETRSVAEIMESEISEIYRTMYWSAAACDRLPYPVSLVQFDTAVQRGPKRAIRELQAVVGVLVDGIFGPRTEAAASAYGQRELIEELCWRRVEHYTERAADMPSQRAFLVGWLRRAIALRTHAVSLIGANP